MHLIKWFRKNMTKLMALFVILIMIAFIMPTVLNQLAKPRSKGLQKAMWYFGNGKKISPNDIRQATDELGVLKRLYTDQFLFSQPDLRLRLLGQLIFPEAFAGAELSDEIKRNAIQNQFRINPARIDDFFEQARGRAELFWILLKAEAKNAGCTVIPKRAGELLNSLIPKITDKSVDAATIVQNAGRAYQMTDDRVLSIFADVLAVINYAKIVTDVEDVTEAEIESIAAKRNEMIDIELVEFSNDTFTDKVSEPDESKIIEQLEKYKNTFPDVITEENPYGFGYKQKPRIAIEYMIIKLEDVKKLIDRPTEEDAEEFYQQNLEIFIEKLPIDPNNPDSETIERQQGYAEVSGIIRNSLETRKVNTRASEILNDAIEQERAGFETLNFETATTEQFKEKSIDYLNIAEKISKQHNIKIYCGKTALLTMKEISADKSLGSLMMQTQSRIPTKLTRLAFATEPLGDEAVKTGPFEPAAPKMYVSIGPLTDAMRTIAAIVRIIDTRKSAVPADINFTYEKNLPQVSEDRKKEDNVFILKDEVRQDCKRKAAFELACKKAHEFIELVEDKEWDKAIEKFNSLYPPKEGEKILTIQKWDQRNRFSQVDIETAKLSMTQLPSAEELIHQSIIYAKLMDKFYSLFKPDKTEAEDVPAIIEFPPQFTCYVVKSLRRRPQTIQDYEKARRQIAYRENYVMTQSMAIEHFMPDNILKRLDLKPAEPAKADANGVQL